MDFFDDFIIGLQLMTFIEAGDGDGSLQWAVR